MGILTPNACWRRIWGSSNSTTLRAILRRWFSRWLQSARGIRTPWNWKLYGFLKHLISRSYLSSSSRLSSCRISGNITERCSISKPRKLVWILRWKTCFLMLWMCAGEMSWKGRKMTYTLIWVSKWTAFQAKCSWMLYARKKKFWSSFLNSCSELNKIESSRKQSSHPPCTCKLRLHIRSHLKVVANSMSSREQIESCRIRSSNWSKNQLIITLSKKSKSWTPRSSDQRLRMWQQCKSEHLWTRFTRTETRRCEAWRRSKSNKISKRSVSTKPQKVRLACMWTAQKWTSHPSIWISDPQEVSY